MAYHDELYRLRRERDDAIRESQRLRESLRAKSRSCVDLEEDLIKSRREVALLRTEVDTLKETVNETRKNVRNSGQNYEELVGKLKKEVSQLQSQKGPSQTEFIEMQKRLVVLGCQLRKAEVSKLTHEVAVNKLTKFVNHLHTKLGGNKGKQKVSSDTAAELASDAKGTIKAVKMLLEEEPLPFGWEEVYSPNGTRYFINHVTQSTTWKHPVSGVQHMTDVNNNGYMKEIPRHK